MTSVAYKKYSEYDFNDIKIEELGRKKTKKKSSVAPKLFVVIILMGALFISVLFGYAAISEIKYQVYEHKQAMDDLQMKIEKYNIVLEAMNKTSIIENKALNELGMRVPDRQQMVYLDANEGVSDITRVSIAVPVEQSDSGFFKNIYSSLLSLVFMWD
jgi:cell division protein FtsL